MIVLLAIVADSAHDRHGVLRAEAVQGMGWSRGAARHVHGRRAACFEPALLIILDRGVGDRESARVLRPDSPSRLARTEREVLELEDVIDGHVGHRAARRTVEEDPVQHVAAGRLQSENPVAGPVIVTFWMFMVCPGVALVTIPPLN